MGQSSGEVIALAVVFPLLALFVICLRIWARQVKKQALAWDDYLIFVAMLFLIAADMTPTIILARDDNLGNHQRYANGMPLKSTYRSNVAHFIAETMGHIAIGLAKLSILLLYLRIFSGTWFYVTTWTTFTLVVIWIIAFFFASMFECTPIPLYLRNGSHFPGVQCFNTFQLYDAHAYSDVIMDAIIILMVPWPQIWNLHLPSSTKLAVTGIFMLGLLTMAASIARLVEFKKAINRLSSGDTDRDYVIAPTVYWTTIEASLAIVAATLPTLRPILKHMSPESVIASVRSVFSLHSIRSPRGSNDDSRGGRDENKSSNSSAEGLHNLGVVGSPGVRETSVERPGLHLESVIGEPHDLKDGIIIQSSWARHSDNAV